MATPNLTQQAGDIQPHAKAEQIIRQVEFYLSDENLPNDDFLLQLCDGVKNKSIPLKTIHGFKKMRIYKPFARVVQALKQSELLEVMDDNTIRRRVPLHPSLLANRAGKPPQPKIEKFQHVASTNPNLPKQMLKPSGFEDDYSEAPITPQEADDNSKLFDPNEPFSERIEAAIQRFKVKKTMHQEIAKVFAKFMKYGGVEIRTQFNGVPKTELKEMSTYEKTKRLATHFVDDDRDDKRRWIVDFEGVAKGFLSSQLPLLYEDYTEQQIHKATQVLRVFYNYITVHEVCPEHQVSITAARKICDLADIELMMCQAAGLALPGAFNTACSVLTGGQHAGKYIGDQSWAQDLPVVDAPWSPIQSLSIADARVLVQFGVGAVGTEKQAETILAKSFPLLTTIGRCKTGLEIVGIEKATPEVIKQVAAFAPLSKHIAPLGTLTCKVWNAPDFEATDLPSTYIPPDANLPAEMTFYVEHEVLARDLKVGMKLEATVAKLAISGAYRDEKPLWFLDSVWDIKCSFFEWLPNELLMGDRELLKEPTHTPDGKYRVAKAGVEDDADAGAGAADEGVEE